MQYNRCMGCHGRDVVSVGGAPDLRESGIALDPEAFWQVVHDGTLLERGMPQFATLTREQAIQIHSYIRAEARKAAVQQGHKP
jgi:quinohemoprotein ethanol dehydrogenase